MRMRCFWYVEVALGRAHAADVEPQHGFHRVQGLFEIVIEVHHDGRANLEALRRIHQLVGVDLLAIGRVVQRQPAVGYLRGPSAPIKIGTSARSGWVIGLSGLPMPQAPGPV